MDKERIDQIHNEVALIHVELAVDPRVMGSGYISATIQKIMVAVELVNSYFTDVQRALTDLKQDVSLRELELKLLRREKLLSPQLQELEVSAEERKAHAEAQVDHEYKEKVKNEYRVRGETPPEKILTLEELLTLKKNEIDSLRTLLACISEKKASLKQNDSAVRLQEKSMETEAKIYPMQAPIRPQNTRDQTRTPQRGEPTQQTPQTQQDPVWAGLVAEDADTESGK